MKTVLIFVLLLSPAFAQQAATQPTPKVSSADCSLVDNSPGCRSFNEMVQGKDKDALAFMTPEYFSYVCFAKDADEFTIFAFSTPISDLYRKDKPSAFESQNSTAFVQGFKNGVSKEFQVLPGKWQRMGAIAEYFSSDMGDQKINASESEISYTETYENLKGSKTYHTVSIRRSTLRFAETFQFPADDKKTTDSFDKTGHCVRY